MAGAAQLFSFIMIILLTVSCKKENSGSDWKTYITTDGIYNFNEITSIVVDSMGNKWMGTVGGGVSKFDGSVWTTYNTANSGLINNWVDCITLDAKHHFWFGTIGGGISEFDGTNWNTYSIQNTDSGLASNNITAINIDEFGIIWFACPQIFKDSIIHGGGLSSFNGISWKQYTPANSGLADDRILSIASDAQGNRWFGTFAGVSEFNSNSWTNFSFSSNNFGLKNPIVYSITTDKTGIKWFGATGVIFKLSGNIWTKYNYTNSSQIINKVIYRCIMVDKNNNKWFGSWGSGLLKFDGSNWTTYNTNNGLVNNYVWSIAQDSPGNIWIGTYNGVSELLLSN